MRVCWAITSEREALEFLLPEKVDSILFSRAFMPKRGLSDELKKAIRNNRCKMMVDSGAFSNFAKPGTVSIDEYMKFLEENRSFCHEYITFDDMRSRHQSVKNHRRLTKNGFEPLFVDHLHFKWHDALDEFYSSGEKLCWGSLVKGHQFKNDKNMMNQRVEQRHCKGEEKPKSKLHLLGVGTGVRKFLPWIDITDSIDSTSWVTGPRRFGHLVWLDMNEDGWPCLHGRPYKQTSEEIRRAAKSKGFDIGEWRDRMIIAIRAHKGYYKKFESRLKKAHERKEDLVKVQKSVDDFIVEQRDPSILDLVKTMDEAWS